MTDYNDPAAEHVTIWAIRRRNGGVDINEALSDDPTLWGRDWVDVVPKMELEQLGEMCQMLEERAETAEQGKDRLADAVRDCYRQLENVHHRSSMRHNLNSVEAAIDVLRTAIRSED